MKWFGRSKKKETVDDETEHLTKLKKDGETTSEKTTVKNSREISLFWRSLPSFQLFFARKLGSKTKHTLVSQQSE